MEDYTEIKKLKNEIETLISQENCKDAEMKLKEYENIYPYDMDIHNMKAYLLCYEEKYDEAEKAILSVYNKYEYNIEINYNLATVYFYKGDYKKALYYLLRVTLLDSDKTVDTKELMDIVLKNVSTKEFENIKHKISLCFINVHKKFPITMNMQDKEERVREFSYNNKNYYCGIYDYYFAERDAVDIDAAPELAAFNKYEIMEYKKAKNYEFKTDCSTVIPIAAEEENQPITLNVNSKDIELKRLLPKRFYYYKVDKDSQVKIKSEHEFILGKMTKLGRNKKMPGLIINIFVDGFSQKYLEQNKDLAPNIYKFFNEGTICTNAHSTGEWTYTSLASEFTGKSTVNHRIYHPRYDTDNLKSYTLYSEIFQKHGYMCTKIDNDFRSNPAIGYMKGFDRYLHQRSERGFYVDDVLTETIEHLESFKDKNNFMWICIPDLHDIADRCESRTSSQINTSVFHRIIDTDYTSTVRQRRDDSLIDRYRAQIKRVDSYLGMLFSYIQRNYDEDDYIVNMMSDHGQGFLLKSDQFLDEERSNIVMMFRGKNIPKGECTEMLSIMDNFPIMLNSIGITDYDKNESNVPKYFGGKESREFSYTESLYPNSPYYAVINDQKYKFFFQTIADATDDARLTIKDKDSFDCMLVNKETQKDETKQNADLVQKYTDIVINHIKEYIII